jgi:hypothetical protein
MLHGLHGLKSIAKYQGEMVSPRQSMASIASMGSYQVGFLTWWVGLVTKNGTGKPMLKKLLEELLNGHKIITKASVS